jgi:hypothetical protein
MERDGTGWDGNVSKRKGEKINRKTCKLHSDGSAMVFMRFLVLFLISLILAFVDTFYELP